MNSGSVVIIGAGVGGLAAAIELASAGREVLVLERAEIPGGKLRDVTVGGVRADGGATQFALRFVFDELFARAGASLEERLPMRRAQTLGRHLWADGSRLDLPADPAAASDAIGAFAGAAAARGHREMLARARRIYETLEKGFLRNSSTTPMGLAMRVGFAPLMAIPAFSTLAEEVARHIGDPRLRQLFNRYATYVGASPILAPATLLLILHAEAQGVWRVEGGTARLAEAMAALAREKGAEIRTGAPALGLAVAGGRARGVRLADEEVAASRVIANIEPAALAAGVLGPEAVRAVEPVPPARRSFSALHWAMAAEAPMDAAPETTLHAASPTAEYADLAHRGRLPAEPTLQLSLADGGGAAVLAVNAPARGDGRLPSEAEIAAQRDAALDRLARAGLALSPGATLTTGPAEWEARFPGTGGALYGAAAHGWQQSFDRPGSRTRLPGLYLAGGGTHPGAGLAMAALSGRLAAQAILEDRA
jgi:1-hydroxycarotenoid 3,4-desaturase